MTKVSGQATTSMEPRLKGKADRRSTGLQSSTATRNTRNKHLHGSKLVGSDLAETGDKPGIGHALDFGKMGRWKPRMESTMLGRIRAGLAVRAHLLGVHWGPSIGHSNTL